MNHHHVKEGHGLRGWDAAHHTQEVTNADKTAVAAANFVTGGSKWKDFIQWHKVRRDSRILRHMGKGVHINQPKPEGGGHI
jgi:hypothetical protein